MSPKIIMDEMKQTRDDLSALLSDAQEACRLAIRVIVGEEDMKPMVTRICELEQKADDEMVRITERLSEVVGKLFLAGLLKRAVVCDAVIAHDVEAMFDLLQHVGESWLIVCESEATQAQDEAKIYVDSMLQNCIVMLEKTIDILNGKDFSEHTLGFIMELDGNINLANMKAHETLFTEKGEKRVLIRLLRVIKSVENLGDKIKSVASYALYIRTGEFIKA